MKNIDPATAGLPVYLRVADAIKRSIRDGTYPPGARIPSRDQMANHYDVSPMTVTNAVLCLAQQGLVEPRRRHGTSITHNALRILDHEEPDTTDQLVAQLAAVRIQLAELTTRVEHLEKGTRR